MLMRQSSQLGEVLASTMHVFIYRPLDQDSITLRQSISCLQLISQAILQEIDDIWYLAKSLIMHI